MELIHLIIILSIGAGVLAFVWIRAALINARAVCQDCGEKFLAAKDNRATPICPECRLQRKMRSEKTLICPSCGDTMQKKPILDDKVIIDKCPGCKGVFLDKGELKKIRDEESSSGNSSGIFTG